MFLEVAGYAFPGSFEIDIDGRQVRHRFLNEQEQLALNLAVEGWRPENLAIRLDGASPPDGHTPCRASEVVDRSHPVLDQWERFTACGGVACVVHPALWCW